MMCGEVASIVADGAVALGVDLPAAAAAAFESYYAFLEKEGGNFNLTAIKGAGDVARFHFLDSIALLNAAHFSGKRVIDVGSGAGFPGVPIKICEPSSELTLLDSSLKRVTFLSQLCNRLETKATLVNDRAEVSAHEPDMRERFDVAVSRAVARLNVLCELCLPFVNVGGIFIAMKGADTADELADSGSAVKALGAELLSIFKYEIPNVGITHTAILLRKVTRTPDKYPRRFARIKNTPL